MNKNLRDIVAAIALSLSHLAPYSAQQNTTQVGAPIAASGIEAIVENHPEINDQSRMSQYYGTGIFDSLYRSINNYLQQHMEDKQDTTKMVPLKFVNSFPISFMGGVLGFTYIGHHSMGKRDDLTGDLSWEVDIHESIHTPDEYETKWVTLWMMEKPDLKYIK